MIIRTNITAKYKIPRVLSFFSPSSLPLCYASPDRSAGYIQHEAPGSFQQELSFPDTSTIVLASASLLTLQAEKKGQVIRSDAWFVESHPDHRRCTRIMLRFSGVIALLGQATHGGIARSLSHIHERIRRRIGLG